jgi:hypothetical protein
MSYFDDEIDDLLGVLCDCEGYHRCEWHERLKQGETRASVERAMKDVLFERHLAWAIQQGIVDPVEE